MKLAALLISFSLGLCAQAASVDGFVVDVLSGKPLAGVHVSLFLPGADEAGESYGAISDPAGRFSIAGIRPGAYVLMPEYAGFMPAVASLTSVATPNMILKPGQQVTDSKIGMEPPAVITGRVVDQFGDPVKGSLIQAEPVPPDSAPFNVVRSRIWRSDDQGRFRISGRHGRYYVSARPPSVPKDASSEIRTDGTTRAVYVTTYFPGATSRERATVAEVKPGAEVSGIEIRLSPQERRLSIAGVVTGALPGSSSTTIVVQYGEKPGRFRSWRSVTAGKDGRFSVSDMQRGSYRLYAQSAGGSTYSRSLPHDLDLDTRDESDVELRLGVAGDLKGVVELAAGRNAGAADGLRVRLEPTGSLFGAAVHAVSGQTDNSGSFQIARVEPGRFSVRLEPASANLYVKSVLVDGRASAGNIADLSNIAEGSTLKLVASQGAGQISGTVRDRNGDVLPGGSGYVVLMQDPEDALIADLSRLSADGKYAFQGIAPGKYRLFAVDTSTGASPKGPDGFRSVAANLEEIVIGEGERIDRDLTPIERGLVNAQPKP